jgi:hypothetical protein
MLASRLAAVGSRLGLVGPAMKYHAIKEAEPMVSGITTFSRSIGQVVEDRLAANPGLKKLWEDVFVRFHLVYAQPETAFKAIDVAAMLADTTRASATLLKIAEEPSSFGALKGKTGLFASKSDEQDRDTALVNVTALARNLGRYLEIRANAKREYETEECAARQKSAINIPALSPSARSALEQVSDSIDRSDLHAVLEHGLADERVRLELEGFARAVAERFGERTFLGISARDSSGQTYRSLTAGMNSLQKAEMKTAWNFLRAAQQLSAQERSTSSLKQSEALRQTIRKGLSLK